MPMQSVKYYRLAEEKGTTLSAANLASLLISKGFHTDARELLIKAQGADDVHPNVNRALASINDQETQETEQWKKCEELAEQHKRFLRRFAEAYYTPKQTSPGFAGNWLLQGGEEIKIAQEKRDSLNGVGKWSEENKDNRPTEEWRSQGYNLSNRIWPVLTHH